MTVPPYVAAALLAWASATDSRIVTETAARAWADALDEHVTIPDGQAAISAHRAVSTDYLMPAHVNLGVRSIRRQRLIDMMTPQPPESLGGDVARELTWQRTYRAAIGDGDGETAASERACAAVGVPVPVAGIPGTPRPIEALTGAHTASCSCGCLTRPVRSSERTR